VKARYLDRQRSGRALILASGTPITNTLGEMYTLLRFLAPEALQERDVHAFDAWASAFGDTSTELELQPSGTYKPVTRFAAFINVADLMMMFRSVADVVQKANLRDQLKLPRIRGGERQLVHDRLVDQAHADVCDTSCPDCLRSYSNLAYHNLLDWRLAIDMANLALDANSVISLSSPLWARVADLAATTLEAARPGFSRTNFGGLPGLTNGTEAIIVTHPLWLTDRAGAGPEIAAAWDDAERTGGLRVDPAWSFISVFEALRRPA
jgi:hypothetical protein